MGCNGSKPAATAQPASQVPPKDTASQQPNEPKTEAKTGTAGKTETQTLKLKINSAHGLRPADTIQSKSDVLVEAFIEGKPESKITTKVVTGNSALRADAEEGAKPSVEVDLKFEGELKGYAPGDKIVFVAKDKDPLVSDVLGRAVVTDPRFGGKVDLEGAGEGYKAFLLVQFGEGSALRTVLQSMEDSLKAATKKLEEKRALAAQTQTLKLKINSAHGLRPADIVHSKSDVLVEAFIEGKPESKVTTKVVTGNCALRADAGNGERPSVEVDLKCEGELKGYAPGDKIVFVAKDKDPLVSDVLGRAVVTDPHFGGRVDLESAGEGYKAFLLVQLGEGSGLHTVVQAMEDSLKAAIEKYGQKKASAVTQEQVVVEDVQEASGGVWCRC